MIENEIQLRYGKHEYIVYIIMVYQIVIYEIDIMHELHIANLHSLVQVQSPPVLSLKAFLSFLDPDNLKTIIFSILLVILTTGFFLIGDLQLF